MTATQGFALLGYSLRFPGAADAGEFWELLADGRDAVSVVPGDRWDADEFFDPDPDAPGKMVARRAGFLDDVVGFRRAVLRGVGTRSDVHGSTAPADAGDHLVRGRARGDRAIGAGRYPNRRLHGAVHARVRGDDRPAVPLGGHRLLFRHRLFRRGGRGTNQLPAGLAGTGRDRGYGVQLVVGGAAPGLPGARLR